MGRRAHKPEPSSRRQVKALAGYGIAETEIAEVIGIDLKTLRKHYRKELRHGHTKANAKVAENLYRRATGEGREVVVAAIFWLKTRAGWRESIAHELSGRDGSPIEVEDASTRDLAKAVLAMLSRGIPADPAPRQLQIEGTSSKGWERHDH